MTFRLGDQKHQVQLPIGKDGWKVTHSFLVYDLKQDQVINRRTVPSVTVFIVSVFGRLL